MKLGAMYGIVAAMLMPLLSGCTAGATDEETQTAPVMAAAPLVSTATTASVVPAPPTTVATHGAAPEARVLNNPMYKGMND